MGAGYSLLPEQQSYEIDCEAKPGESKPRRLVGIKELPSELKEGGGKAATIWHLFETAAGKFANSPCIGKRMAKPDGSMPFEFINYATTLKQIRTVGSGLKNLGLAPKEGLGIYAANRMEWMLTQMAGFSQNLVCVPLYDTLGENAVKYEITHAELKCVVVEQAKLANVAAVAKQCPTLKFVVQIEPLTGAEDKAAFDAAGVTLLDFGMLSKSGAEKPQEPSPPAPDDLSYIMYTSGTTGDPKGVLLTHRAVAVAASWSAGIEILPTDRRRAASKRRRAPRRASARRLGLSREACGGGPRLRSILGEPSSRSDPPPFEEAGVRPRGRCEGARCAHLAPPPVHLAARVAPPSRYLSWLPLAHIFETMVEQGVFAAGGSVGYFQGDIKKLMDDIQALQPTVFIGVPRIFARVYDKATKAIEEKGPTVSALFKWAMGRELEARKGGGHSVFSFLFKSVRKALGGEVRARSRLSLSLPLSASPSLRAASAMHPPPRLMVAG